MIKKVLLCTMVMSMSFLWAQTMTLQDALDIALKNNANVQTQALLLEQASKKASNQWNNFLPTVNLSANYGNTGHQMLPTANGGSWDWSAGLGITLPLSANIPVEMKIASLDYDIALTAYNKLLQSIETQVAATYYGILAANANLVSLENGLQLAKDEYDQVTNRYSIGAANELDMLRAQYSYESAVPALRKAESSFRELLTDFLLLLGANTELLQPFASATFETLETARTFELDGIISPIQMELPSAKDLLIEYTNNTVVVIEKTQALERSQLSASSGKIAAYAPSITLSENLSMSENNVGSDPIKINGSFSIGLRLPLDNLIPGSKGNLNLQKADDAITIAELNLETAKNTARQSIREKAVDIDRLWVDISTATLNLSIVERTYELSQEAYQNGLLEQTDLETARQNLTNAQIALVNAEIAYINGAYALASTLNINILELYELYGKADNSTAHNISNIGEING